MLLPDRLGEDSPRVAAFSEQLIAQGNLGGDPQSREAILQARAERRPMSNAGDVVIVRLKDGDA